MKAEVLHVSPDADIREILAKVLILNNQKSKEAFPLIEQAYSLSQKSEDNLLKAEVLHAKAQYHCEINSNYDVSISLLEKAVEIAGSKAPLSFLIKVNVAIGINYYYKGNLDIALKYYVRSISIAEKREEGSDSNPCGLASLYYNVATIFSGKQMYDLRKEYLNKALQIAKQHNNHFLEGRVLNGLGGIFLEEEKFDEALELLHVALYIAETQNDNTGYAISINNIGLTYVESGRHAEAIEYLLKGLSIKQQGSNKQSIAQSYLHLGICYNKANKPREAIHFMDLAIALLAEIGAAQMLAECYMNIAESYAYLNDYGKAYQFQLQCDKIRDQLFNSNKASSISETISSFEISRNLREAESLINQSQKVKELTERLERGNLELKQFTNLVAHDFKEPLRMIRGYIQLIKRHLKSNLTNDEAELIQAAEAGVKQMDLLLQSLMELAKLNAKPVFTQVDLNEILLQAKINLSESIIEKNAKVYSDVLPIVSADFIQMVQLFQNLIGNGIKYNKSEMPEVRITVQQHTSYYLISFADNGIGIDESYREKVFELFQRLHSKYEYTGSGIGLSICKKVIDGIGGKIKVEDSEIGGAAFVVEIPC